MQKIAIGDIENIRETIGHSQNRKLLLDLINLLYFMRYLELDPHSPLLHPET